jgi:uncharacterized protein DUF6174
MQGFFGRAGIGAAFVLMIGGCAGEGPVGLGGTTTSSQQTYQTEYDLALKRWQDKAPAHYQIVYQQTCECTVEMQRPTRVTVRRTGNTETIEDVADAGSPPGTLSNDRLQSAKTVNGLFDVISQSLAQNPQDARITYEGTYGYPVSINIDPTDVPGDEIVYKVTSFQAIP